VRFKGILPKHPSLKSKGDIINISKAKEGDPLDG
jgi:hypothetical protein